MNKNVNKMFTICLQKTIDIWYEKEYNKGTKDKETRSTAAAVDQVASVNVSRQRKQKH